MTTTATKQSPASCDGSKTLKKILNESAAVPLFIPQTFINSLRDVGYNSTTSALCEHVDNALQANASEVRIYFNQTGKRGSYEIDTLVYDNGSGMEPDTLQLCMSFGGSMNYNNRHGIGRFGVGMKTSALSLTPTLEVYSWTEPKALYKMILDVCKISENTSLSMNLPEPEFISNVPDEISKILSAQMDYPKSKQVRLVNSNEQVSNNLGKSGTIIYMPKCDRLSYKTSRTLVDHATAEMSRVYREHIIGGVKIYINNRLLTAYDPTYWMKGSRHATSDALQKIDEKYSKLVNTWEIQIPLLEGSEETAPISVRLYKLPYETWGKLPKSELAKLNLYEHNLVSVMRNDREVFCGIRPGIFKFHGDRLWARVRIDFGGELDEAFGVAMNKQGIRPTAYVDKLIRQEISDDLSRIQTEFKKWRANKNQPKPDAGKKTEAERRAQDAEGHQTKQISNPKEDTPEEKAEIDANIRGLAVVLKRDGEKDEEAFNRIKDSKYITNFIHDEYHPFYNVEAKIGKVILTINKAHAFYDQLYRPLSAMVTEAIGRSEQESEGNENASNEQMSLLAALQMLLFSLGRTQTVLQSSDSDGSKAKLYKEMHIEWSKTLETQLLTK